MSFQVLSGESSSFQSMGARGNSARGGRARAMNHGPPRGGAELGVPNRTFQAPRARQTEPFQPRRGNFRGNTDAAPRGGFQPFPQANFQTNSFGFQRAPRGNLNHDGNMARGFDSNQRGGFQFNRGNFGQRGGFNSRGGDRGGYISNRGSGEQPTSRQNSQFSAMQIESNEGTSFQEIGGRTQRPERGPRQLRGPANPRGDPRTLGNSYQRNQPQEVKISNEFNNAQPNPYSRINRSRQDFQGNPTSGFQRNPQTSGEGSSFQSFGHSGRAGVERKNNLKPTNSFSRDRRETFQTDNSTFQTQGFNTGSQQMPERQQRIKGRLSNRENSRESSNLGINYSNVEVSTSRGQSFQDMGRGNQRGRRGDRIDRGREVEGERGGQDRNRSKPRGDRVRGEGRIRGNSNRGANGSQGSNRKLEVKPKGSILSRITRAAPGSQPEENDSEEDEERDDSENFEASYSDGGDEEGYSKYSDSQDNDSGLVRYSQEDGEESEEDDFRKEAQKPQPAKPRIILKRQQPQEEERKPPSSILKPYVPKIEPGLPPLVKRPSEKELTPLGRNTSTNMSSFLQDKSGDNDLLMKKYKLYLQRRKKKCADFSSELDKMLVAVEKLDTERAQCMGMCSRQEIRDRESQNNVDVFERLPGAHKRMDAQLAIKKFTRSSADKNLDIPEILRPPFFLHQSLEHIMTKVVDDDLKEVSTFVSPHSERERVEFLDIYLFVSDRLRSLRQDMNILQSHLPGIATSKLYITILEQIVRFYIISANELLDQEDFSPTVNQTALSSVSTSLVDSYSLARKSLANLIGKSSE